MLLAALATAVVLVLDAPGPSPELDAVVAGLHEGLARSGSEIRTPSALATALTGEPATGALEEAQRGLELATRHYLALDLSAAESALESVESRHLAKIGGAAAFALRIQVLERRAIVMLAQEREAEAARALSILYGMDPAFVPDPSLLSPRFRPAFGRASAGAASASRAAVAVTTTPPGADVWLDGRPAGAAPVRAETTAGAHWLEARLAGHASYRRMIEAHAGGVPTKLAITLPRHRDAAERRSSVAEALAARAIPADRARFAADIASVTGADSVAIVSWEPDSRRVRVTSFDAPFEGAKEGRSIERSIGTGEQPLAVGIAMGVELARREPRPVPAEAIVVRPARPPAKSTAVPARRLSAGRRWLWVGAGVLAAGAAGGGFLLLQADEPAPRKTIRHGDGT